VSSKPERADTPALLRLRASRRDPTRPRGAVGLFGRTVSTNGYAALTVRTSDPPGFEIGYTNRVSSNGAAILASRLLSRENYSVLAL
jgi:hypothetical protein